MSGLNHDGLVLPGDLLVRSYLLWTPFACVGLRWDRPLLVFYMAGYKLLHLVVMKFHFLLTLKPVVHAYVIDFLIVCRHLLF